MKTEQEMTPDLQYSTGDTLLCIKDFAIVSGEIKFSKGKVYVAHCKESIKNNSGIRHWMKPDADSNFRLDEHFEHISLDTLMSELSSKEALIGELKEALHKANLIIDETEFKDGNTHKMVREALNKVK